LKTGKGALPFSGMPICERCDHRGEDHNWLSQLCSQCANKNWRDRRRCFENYKRGRKRGQCRVGACDCPAYKPLTNRSAPINKYLARAIYLKPKRRNLAKRAR
jgi:hypothetical protein